ncbi:hypothetical protein HDV05_008629 [Chytridiales sp. JEL 0842]|nr:hypothetical protein HDV05_008629 [Chytridiales sp. JEL 0842]
MQIDDDAYPNVFAAGDIIDTDHIKTAYFAWEHMKVVMANIVKLIRGDQQVKLSVYKAPPPMIVVYLGQSRGAAQYNLWGIPILLPNFLTKRFFTYNVGADRAWQWLNQNKEEVLQKQPVAGSLS